MRIIPNKTNILIAGLTTLCVFLTSIIMVMYLYPNDTKLIPVKETKTETEESIEKQREDFFLRYHGFLKKDLDIPEVRKQKEVFFERMRSLNRTRDYFIERGQNVVLIAVDGKNKKYLNIGGTDASKTYKN